VTAWCSLDEAAASIPSGSWLAPGGLMLGRAPMALELELIGAYATSQGELETALGLTRAGKLSPFVTEVMPLAGAARAHTRLENREVAGRLVLSPDAA
jgi:D-arabinose 1-dehydrogenase-like Zn-dependent alcohol dehydrogenase